MPRTKQPVKYILMDDRTSVAEYDTLEAFQAGAADHIEKNGGHDGLELFIGTTAPIRARQVIEIGEAHEPAAPQKRKGRPKGARNKPKPEPAVSANAADPVPPVISIGKNA